MEIQFGGNLHDEFKVFDGDAEAMQNFLRRVSNDYCAYIHRTNGDNYLVNLDLQTQWEEDEDGNEFETDAVLWAFEFSLFGDGGEEFVLTPGDVVYPLKWPNKMIVELSDVI